jgi:hypothetical protein
VRLKVTRTARIVAPLAASLAGLALAGPVIASSAASADASPQFQVQQILNGMNLQHTFTPAESSTSVTDPLTAPDDITALGQDLFVSFQNGVGAQGEPTSDGNTASTVVEFTSSGTVISQWDLTGKVDGLTADPQTGLVIATVNEDDNSSIYTIQPDGPAGMQIQHYAYNETLPHFGGTDAISIYQGQVLVSASAPGTATGSAAAPQPTYPAVYSVTFDPATLVATATPLFYDEDPAVTANVGPGHGTVAPLALTDPDSSEVVPYLAHRFGGAFMLDSQGDLQQIFLQGGDAQGGNAQGGNAQGDESGSRLTVLNLAASVDDSAWATSSFGRLFGADASTDTVDMVTGPFRPGTMFAAVTPCNANAAPASCPAPGFPANYLGVENMWTGGLTAVTLTGPSFQPHSLIFVGG